MRWCDGHDTNPWLVQLLAVWAKTGGGGELFPSCGQGEVLKLTKAL